MSDRKSHSDTETEDGEGTETAVAAEPVDTGTPYISPVAEPVVEEPSPQPESLDIPSGYTALVYRGRAHVVRHGDFEFRSGRPVIVPNDVAEDLLTLPHEKFEAIKKE